MGGYYYHGSCRDASQIWHKEGTEGHCPQSWSLHPLPPARWPTLPLVSSGDQADFSLLNPFWKDQDRAEVIHRGEGAVDLKNAIASTLCWSSVLGLSKRGFLGWSPASVAQGGQLCAHLVPTCSLVTPGTHAVCIFSAHSTPCGPSDFTHEREV